MNSLRNLIYTAIILATFLAACGPSTPTPLNQNGLQLAPTLISNQALQPVPLGSKPLACKPPTVTIDQVTPSCTNKIKGVGGVSFVVNASDPNSVMINLPKGNATCKYGGTPNTDSCTGTQNGKFQEEVCTMCAAPNAGAPQSYGAFTCAKGYVNHQGVCDPADPKQYTGACPVGSHYNNDIQNCVDDATLKLASPCPAGYPYYLPDASMCLAKPYPAAYNCQYFPLQLGSCGATQAGNAPFNVVPFCQNNGANKGGANITYEAGNSLAVDVKGNRLDGCTASGANLTTCWGPAGQTFNFQLCTDPAKPETCTSYKETLGACAKDNNPAAEPTSSHK